MKELILCALFFASSSYAISAKVKVITNKDGKESISNETFKDLKHDDEQEIELSSAENTSCFITYDKALSLKDIFVRCQHAVYNKAGERKKLSYYGSIKCGEKDWHTMHLLENGTNSFILKLKCE